MYRDHRVGVVVPAYCEARILPRTLEGMPGLVDHIVVVDDGSPDATAEVARATSDPRIEVIALERNSGVGRAICEGYRRALELELDIVCVMAADDQMDPRDLPILLDAIVEGADYAKGDRLAHPERKAMPLVRRAGTATLAKLTGLIAGLPELRDSQCGYTAIRAGVLDKLPLAELYPRYGYPNDMILRLAELGATIVQPAVRPVYADERSGLKPWKVVVPISGILLRGALRRAHRPRFQEK